MSLIDEIWYEKTLTSYALRIPLYPFSLMFRFVSALRRSSYMSNQDKAKAPPVPVIVVGGLSAGGAGKTPLCAALLNELKARGYHPGLLSRGYKSRVKSYPCLLDDKSTAKIAGDEPLLIYKQCQCPVVIDPKRVRGADFLYKQGVDVIVCDDGLQHYALARDVEIAVLDGARMLGNRLLMPAGPLREGQWRLQTVDAVVVNGAVAKIGNYSMTLRPEYPKPLNTESASVLPPGSEVCALAGIGNPERFYKTVEDLGFKIKTTLKAGDHERLNPARIKKQAELLPVVMTRKDAVKYEGMDLDNVYVIDVKANLSQQFYDSIENKFKAVKEKILKRGGSSLGNTSPLKKTPASPEPALKSAFKTSGAAVSADHHEKIFQKPVEEVPVSMFKKDENTQHEIKRFVELSEPVSAFKKESSAADQNAPIFKKPEESEPKSLFARDVKTPHEIKQFVEPADPVSAFEKSEELSLEKAAARIYQKPDEEVPVSLFATVKARKELSASEFLKNPLPRRLGSEQAVLSEEAFAAETLFKRAPMQDAPLPQAIFARKGTEDKTAAEPKAAEFLEAADSHDDHKEQN